VNATLKDYSRQQLAAQPIGAWTGMAFRLVVGALREQLAVEGLTQPHWWILNHAAGSPGRWNREELTERLVPRATPGPTSRASSTTSSPAAG